MSRKYDHEFKDKVAREAISVNNISATAKKHGVNPNSVRKWIKDLEVRLGMGETQNKTEIGSEKEIASFMRENVDLRRKLDLTQRDLKEAMTLIGEKDLYIKKLEKSLER